ncbi:MAG: class I SAM-dependent methyltransferase [Bacteroidia bacterium]
MNCKICNSGTAPFYKGKILNKYEVDYFKCNSCGFVQTENPYWLKEAYNEAIAQLDIGLAARNIDFSGVVEKLILTFYPGTNNYLDYGGGYGLFVRLMRDKGFSFYRYDSYCQNIFAQYFDWKDCSVKKFDMITAFEVFEHLPEPLSDIEKMFELSDTVFFSTLIVPTTGNEFENWWYRAPLSGQHIAFYSMDSLNVIAKKFNKRVYSNNKNQHLITNKEIDCKRFENIFAQPDESILMRLAKKLSGEPSYFKRKSLQEEDYRFIEQEILKQIK